MNPWSFYEHKPQLIESVVVAAVAVRTIRLPEWSDGARLTAMVGALGWAALGVLDYFAYAFGYQFARWTAKDVVAVQSVLAWLGVPLAIAAVIALATLVPRRS